MVAVVTALVEMAVLVVEVTTQAQQVVLEQLDREAMVVLVGHQAPYRVVVAVALLVLVVMVTLLAVVLVVLVLQIQSLVHL